MYTQYYILFDKQKVGWAQVTINNSNNQTPQS